MYACVFVGLYMYICGEGAWMNGKVHGSEYICEGRWAGVCGAYVLVCACV